MYLLPNSIGEALLQRSWQPAHDVILPYTAVMAASGMLTAATVGLRAMAAAKRSMRSRLITGVLSVTPGTVGAATYGAVGAALGLAAGLWIGGIQWWKQLADAVPRRRSAGAAAAGRRSTRRPASTPAPASTCKCLQVWAKFPLDNVALLAVYLVNDWCTVGL